MSDFPQLETDRLLLREIVAEDAPDLFAIHGNAEAMRWFGADPVTSLQQAHNLVEVFAGWRHLPNPGTRWGIQQKADNRFVGSCGLFKWNRSWKSCVTGYELAPFAQGTGLMFEALSAILDWGFETMQLNRVEAQVHPQNIASIRLLQKLGFKQEGHMREAGFWCGEHHDLQLFALLRLDYLTRRSERLCAGSPG
jgi:[ribosomal protein S5]-alanine N-acetyltransferase